MTGKDATTPALSVFAVPAGNVKDCRPGRGGKSVGPCLAGKPGVGFHATVDALPCDFIGFDALGIFPGTYNFMEAGSRFPWRMALPGQPTTFFTLSTDE